MKLHKITGEILEVLFELQKQGLPNAPLSISFGLFTTVIVVVD